MLTNRCIGTRYLSLAFVSLPKGKLHNNNTDNNEKNTTKTTENQEHTISTKHTLIPKRLDKG